MIKYEFINTDHEKEPENLHDRLPAFVNDVAHSRHYLGNGSTVRIYWCCAEKDFFDYIDVLVGAGFELWQENRIGTNFFATLVNGELHVHLEWFAYMSQVRVLVEPQSTLPVRKSENVFTDRGFRPTVTQLRSEYSDVDCGMSYACQLCDGSFVVIDGGMSNHGEADQLYNHLISKLPEGEKPVIAFWILTHHHPDHVNCFKDFADKYLDKVDVEALVYNNPSYDKSKRTGEYLIGEYTLIEQAVEKFPETTKLYMPHTGDVYHIRNAVFECLWCQDGLTGDSMSNTNNTSVVFRMTLGKRKVMWMGDASAKATRFMIPAYGFELAADTVQIAHHGYGDPDWAVYYYMRPKEALWPVPEYRTATIEGLSAYLVGKLGVKTLYFSHTRDYTLDC